MEIRACNSPSLGQEQFGSCISTFRDAVSARKKSKSYFGLFRGPCELRFGVCALCRLPADLKSCEYARQSCSLLTLIRTRRQRRDIPCHRPDIDLAGHSAPCPIDEFVKQYTKYSPWKKFKIVFICSDSRRQPVRTAFGYVAEEDERAEAGNKHDVSMLGLFSG